MFFLYYFHNKMLYVMISSEEVTDMITFKQLEYFYEAAQLEHFNQAAEKLGISEPSLSRAINQLEAEIGLTLFEKRGRGVVLTKPGRLFLSHAGTILQQVRNSQARMQELADGAGHIDIAYVAPLAHSYIPQMIRRFQCLPGNENVTFNFYQGLTDSNLQGLKTGKYDLVFGSFSGNEPSVCFVHVLIQEMVVIVPRNHPLAAKEIIDLKDFEKYPHISYDRSSGLGQASRKFFREHDLHPAIICESPDENGISSFVAENMGIGLVADCDAIHRASLRICHLPERVQKHHTVYMAFMSGRYQMPAVQSLIRFIREDSAAMMAERSIDKTY